MIRVIVVTPCLGKFKEDLLIWFEVHIDMDSPPHTMNVIIMEECKAFSKFQSRIGR